MAIAFRGAVAGTPAANPTSGDFSPSSISGIASGDLVLCVWYSRANTKTLTLDDSSGFTLVEDYANATYGRLIIYRAFYGTPTDWGFTCGSVANGTTGWFAMAFSGVDSTTPVLAEASAVAVGSDAAPNPPSVACGSTTGCAIVCLLGEMDDNAITATSTYTIPTGASWTSSAGTDAGSAGQYKLDQTGTVDPGTMTLGASDPWCVHTIALQPSSAPAITATMTHARSTKTSFGNSCQQEVYGVRVVGVLKGYLSSTGQFTITHGFTIQSGDLIVVTAMNGNGGTSFTDDNSSYPFTEHVDENHQDASSAHAIYSRVAGSSEPSSYLFSHTGGATQVDEWVIVQLRGNNTSSPWTVTPSTTNRYQSSAATSIPVPSITVAADDTALVFAWTDSATAEYTAVDNGFAPLCAAQRGGNVAICVYVKGNLSAGSLGTTTISVSASQDVAGLAASIAKAGSTAITATVSHARSTKSTFGNTGTLGFSGTVAAARHATKSTFANSGSLTFSGTVAAARPATKASFACTGSLTFSATTTHARSTKSSFANSCDVQNPITPITATVTHARATKSSFTCAGTLAFSGTVAAARKAVKATFGMTGTQTFSGTVPAARKAAKATFACAGTLGFTATVPTARKAVKASFGATGTLAFTSTVGHARTGKSSFTLAATYTPQAITATVTHARSAKAVFACVAVTGVDGAISHARATKTSFACAATYTPQAITATAAYSRATKSSFACSATYTPQAITSTVAHSRASKSTFACEATAGTNAVTATVAHARSARSSFSSSGTLSFTGTVAAARKATAKATFGCAGTLGFIGTVPTARKATAKASFACAGTQAFAGVVAHGRAGRSSFTLAATYTPVPITATATFTHGKASFSCACTAISGVAATVAFTSARSTFTLLAFPLSEVIVAVGRVHADWQAKISAAEWAVGTTTTDWAGRAPQVDWRSGRIERDWKVEAP